MTDEELDRARAEEASRRVRHLSHSAFEYGALVARLAREGWTPPAPLEVAAAEILKKHGYTLKSGLAALLVREGIERGIEIGKQRMTRLPSLDGDPA